MRCVAWNFLCVQCIRVRAAQDNNASDESNILRKIDHNQTTLQFSGDKPLTPLLDTINYPIHMKNLSIEVKKTSLFSFCFEEKKEKKILK